MELLCCHHCDQNQNTIIQKDNSEFVAVQIMLIQFLIFFYKKLQIYNPKTELYVHFIFCLEALVSLI